MNTKDNQRSRVTKILIKQAYLKLMKEKKDGRITVTDVCREAEINRSSFYLHYNETNEILIELEDEAIAGVVSAMSKLGSFDEEAPGADQPLLAFLRSLKSGDTMLRALLIDNNDMHFRRKLRDVAVGLTGSAFRIDLPDEIKKPMFLYIVSGSLELLCDWIKTDYRIPERKMCELLFAFNKGIIMNAYKLG